jgi:uracil-DNA glycosylase
MKPPPQLEKTWQVKLENQWSLPYMKQLAEFLAKQRAEGEVYPPKELVFSAFEKVPFSKVKVVIVGQDPYHGPGQAHGLSFSVPKGVTPPPSLKNIFKELQADLGITPPAHGCLEKWAEQGVLLLNATLTVLRGQPLSHAKQGWETFTDAVIEALLEREEPVIFVLWGKYAQDKCKKLIGKTIQRHHILMAAHPSPFSATHFLGCRHFSKINDLLKREGKEPIDWSL